MTDSLPMGSLSPYCSTGHGRCGMVPVAKVVVLRSICDAHQPSMLLLLR